MGGREGEGKRERERQEYKKVAVKSMDMAEALVSWCRGEGEGGWTLIHEGFSSSWGGCSADRAQALHTCVRPRV